MMDDRFVYGPSTEANTLHKFQNMYVFLDIEFWEFRVVIQAEGPIYTVHLLNITFTEQTSFYNN